MSSTRFFRAGLPVTRRQDRTPEPAVRPRGRRVRGDPLGPLLASLRGRRVTLLVGGRLLTGKLVLADPVTLVDGAGRATVVRRSAIQAVRF